LFVPRDLYSIMAAAAPPEVMVRAIKSAKELFDRPVDVWAIGPGLGPDRAVDMLKLIDQAKQPAVLDADALNALSGKTDLLKRSPGPRLLTPHPGEMNRLVDSGKMSRAGLARHFCEQFPVTLLLKGSRTIVSERTQPLSYNSTGNPGMATGGMGDVLTGVCAGLMGRGLNPYDAARVGAWACGRAAEIAIFRGGQSEESLVPRDLLKHLGKVFNELRETTVGAEAGDSAEQPGATPQLSI
jgi:NAD(P)H-hydrate epimerase